MDGRDHPAVALSPASFPPSQSAGRSATLRKILAKQGVCRARVAFWSLPGSFQRVPHDLDDRLIVCSSACAHALRKRAAIGEIGVRVDLEDVRVARVGL